MIWQFSGALETDHDFMLLDIKVTHCMLDNIYSYIYHFKHAKQIYYNLFLLVTDYS